MLPRELDAVAPHNPVCLLDFSYHACYVNSAALTLAGIDRHTPDPPQGRILRDQTGEPDGTLWERAMNLLHTISLGAYLDYYRETVTDLMYHNGMRHLACGITSVGDALVMPEARKMYRLADTRKQLPLTVHQMLGGVHLFAPPAQAITGGAMLGRFRTAYEAGRSSSLWIRSTPALPSFATMPVATRNVAARAVIRKTTSTSWSYRPTSAASRWRCIAWGRGPWEQALHAFEHAQRAHPRTDPRFRLEHCLLPTLSQIKRAQSLGVIATVQPPFILRSGDRHVKRAEEMGGDVRALPFKTMLAAGMVVAASSDSPGCPVDPLLGLYAMVTRRTQSEGPPAGPEEAVTPLEGLRMYTINAAYAMGREWEVGSLEPGKRADMVVLSHDPTAVDPAFLRDVMVEQTYVEGQCLYQR